MAYEKANEKSGRLFVTDQQKLADNPKLPALNGVIVIDGIALYLGLWKRTAKNGGEYFTAELTYPKDEEARLVANGKPTSSAAKKEAEYDAAHPKSKENAKSRWESRKGNKPQPKENPRVSADDGEADLPF